MEVWCVLGHELRSIPNPHVATKLPTLQLGIPIGSIANDEPKNVILAGNQRFDLPPAYVFCRGQLCWVSHRTGNGWNLPMKRFHSESISIVMADRGKEFGRVDWPGPEIWTTLI